MCKYLPPFGRLPFCFVDGFLHCAKDFYFDVISFVCVNLRSPSLRRLVQKNVAKMNVKSLSPAFSSRSFMVSGPTFRSLVHFEFIFCIW